jgi:hypothetical protein
LKKIKKFKVKPRPSSVLRGLKALMGGTQPTPELEKAIEAEITRAEPSYSTAALYETYDKQKTPSWAGALWQSNPETGAEPVALTLYAASIGPAIEGELGDALGRGEALRSQILTALGDEAAEQAANFVYRLLGDEAKDEGCDLAPRSAVAPELQRDLLSALDAGKVDIQMDSLGHLLPRFTKTGYVLWWPPAKKKK